MEGDKRKEDCLTAVWFAAGTAASIACIERAIVVSLFAHWRVWVFLALNLLLLAILFTSKSEPRVDDQNGFTNTKLNRKKRSLDNGHAQLLKNEDNVEAKMKTAESDVIQEAQYQLTKEELNQRVEAFIAMFRQHLVSDAMEKTSGLQGSIGQVNSTRCTSFSNSVIDM
ncbi:hypothetical protein F511_02316 [Dorcoceras hygrometricum]|uniref:Uncharacterized protein n=1 Tax=Dorcoceras hygrometricum TaxID=472368 RepID=A0A2Z7CLH8_9LAMI|nr:hypothetical protein F511_02316 [Dorcoceras hygrometricum]